mgnify:CR=1 FL=1
MEKSLKIVAHRTVKHHGLDFSLALMDQLSSYSAQPFNLLLENIGPETPATTDAPKPEGSCVDLHLKSAVN